MVHNWSKKGEQQKQGRLKLWNTLDPKQIGLDLLRSTWCELFRFQCLIVLDLEHFKVLGGLVFGLFTIYSHFMVCFVFLFFYYTDPFKIPLMNVTWEFYQNFRQTKKFKKTMKSLNNFWKQSMCTTLFWLSLNSLSLLEGWDIFTMIQKLPTQCRNFLENKGTLRTIWKFPDILESFQTIWKLSRHSGNFPDNMEIVHQIWKVYRQPVNFLDNH